MLESLQQELGIRPGETTLDGKFTLKNSHCLGACGLAPVILIDRDIDEQVTPEEIPFILAKYR